MKQVIKMKASDGDSKVVVSVTVDVPWFVLTRGEQLDWRRRLENRVFDLLRNEGFDVSEIKK